MSSRSPEDLLQEIDKLHKKNLELKKNIKQLNIHQKELMEREAGSRALMEACTEAVFIFENGYCIETNQTAVDLFGYSGKELIGICSTDLVAAESKELIQSSILNCTEEPYEALAQKKDGTLFWAEFWGKTHSYNGRQVMITRARNISTRRKVEQLQELEKFHNNIFNLSPSGILLEDENGRIIDVNNAFCNMMGYKREYQIGKKVHFLSHPDIKHHVDENIRRILSGETLQFIEKSVRNDGSECYIQLNEQRITLPDGKPGIISIAQDMTKQFLAEDALKISESRYRYFVDQTAEGFYRNKLAEPISVNLPVHEQIKLHYKYAYVQECNDIFARMYGYDNAESLIGEKMENLHGGSDVPENIEATRTFIENNYKIIDVETFETDKHGRNVYFLNNAVGIIKDGCLISIWGTQRNITEKKEAEKALSESEKKFKLLVNNSLTGIYINHDFRIKYCNQRFADILGYDTPEELVNTHIKDLTAPESWKLVQKNVQIKLSGKEHAHRYAFTCVRKDGSLCEVEVFSERTIFEGRPAVQGTMMDITERKQAEEEVNRLATVVKQAVDSICICDINGAYQYVNPAFEQTSGYHASEVTGKTPAIIKSGKHTKSFYNELWKTLRKGEKWQGIFINKRKNGKLFYQKSEIFPVKDKHGIILNYVAIQRDITLERKLEQQLQQIQKMEAVGTLSGGIAHDFNNLLTVINGHAEGALLNTGKDKRLHKSLLAILNAGHRAERLTSQLLAFSRRQMHEPKIINIKTIIMNLDDMLRRLIPEDIQIKIHFEKDLPFIKADPNQIEQVLINLAINARDAIKESKRNKKLISIDAKQTIIDDLYVKKHPGSHSGPHILISVKDTGIGMEKDILSYIYEPFFTTKEVGKGTGLGLSTVYGIVKQNDGYITVESKYGRGSSFTVLWPVTSEKPKNLKKQKQNLKDFKGTETILLVEDDHNVREFTSDTLSSLGYNVIEAVNGKAALKLLKDKKPSLDLVITDLVMPEMDGTSLSKKLADIVPKDRVLFISGYNQEYLLQDGTLKEKIRFLQKPYSIQNLVKTVRDMLDK